MTIDVALVLTVAALIAIGYVAVQGAAPAWARVVLAVVFVLGVVALFGR